MNDVCASMRHCVAREHDCTIAADMSVEQDTQSRETGQIKSMTDKGYGFIRRPVTPSGIKQPSLFVHADDCNNCFDTFRVGTFVEYSIGEDEQGRLLAVNVLEVKR